MDYNTEKKQRGAKAKQPPRDLQAEALDVIAELNLAAIPSRNTETGERLTLIQRVRLIPGVFCAETSARSETPETLEELLSDYEKIGMVIAENKRIMQWRNKQNEEE